MSATKKWAVGDDVVLAYYSNRNELVERNDKVSVVGRRWVSVTSHRGRFDGDTGLADPNVCKGTIYRASEYPAVKKRREDIEQLSYIRHAWGGFDWLTDDEVSSVASVVRTARARSTRGST